MINIKRKSLFRIYDDCNNIEFLVFVSFVSSDL